MAEHTPGPWKILDELYVTTSRPDDDMGLYVGQAYGPSTPEAAANARMIAAAPDMLEALENLEHQLQAEFGFCLRNSNNAVQQARNAIAKAKGE